jgi:hypothetical protein
MQPRRKSHPRNESGRMTRGGLSVLCLSLLSCSGNSTSPAGDDSCHTLDLPLSGEQNAPVITDVALEVQPGSGIVVLVTAADPQGSENLQDVLQIVRVFQDQGCDGSPIVLQDDLAYSGVEESFGTAVPSSNQALYDAIAAADSWPVALEFSDANGNTTSGRVMARIIQP